MPKAVEAARVAAITKEYLRKGYRRTRAQKIARAIVYGPHRKAA